MPAEPLPPPDLRKHRAIVYLLCEIQEVNPQTNENKGIPKIVEREIVNIDGESLAHCRQRLSDFLFLSKRFFQEP